MQGISVRTFGSSGQQNLSGGFSQQNSLDLDAQQQQHLSSQQSSQCQPPLLYTYNNNAQMHNLPPLKPTFESVVQLDNARLLDSCGQPTSNRRIRMLPLTNNGTGEETFLTRRAALYVLSSILTVGILMMLLIPLGSTYLYIDYRQQLVQRKSNKNDLCERQKCEFGAECILDDYHQQPYCRCPLTCPDEFKPICGNDGEVYDNLCFLKLESCTRQTSVLPAPNNHTCGDAQFQDKNRRCGAGLKCNRYQRCRNISGVAQCVCQLENCSKDSNKPVCGSNGKIYSNQCELFQYACFYQTDIEELSSNHCQQPNSPKPEVECENCAPFSQCRDGKCECPTEECEAENRTGNETQICASNGQTYANECELKRDACLRRDVNLHKLHPGRCGQCAQECRFFSECKLNENNIPECLCPQVCVRVDQPVCGDNGITYENECELRIASCRHQAPIAVRFNGSCDLCHDVVCHHGSQCIDGECVCENKCLGADEPLCANDGNTYRNECEMQRIACNSKRELIAFYHGHCESAIEVFRSSEPETAGYAATNPHLLEQSTDSLDSSLSVLHPPTECSRLQQTCHQEEQRSGLENNFIYVCDNRTFTSKCSMLEFTCASSEHWQKCTKFCHCNKHGVSQTQACDQATGTCKCKVGVTGETCDECDPHHFGFSDLAHDPESPGCESCQCNRYGSLSPNCNQETGECSCKPGVRGARCDHCPAHHHLTSTGCVPNGRSRAGSRDKSSYKQNCNRKCQFGAQCRDHSNDCSCEHFHCKDSTHKFHNKRVCASDGTVHLSMCHFRRHVCLQQSPIEIVDDC